MAESLFFPVLIILFLVFGILSLRLALAPNFVSTPGNAFLSFCRLFLLSVLFATVYNLSQWGACEWAAIQQERDAEVADAKNRVSSMQHQLNTARRQYAELKALFNGTHAENSLLKADNAQAQQAHASLLRKHINVHSLTYNLSSKLSSVSSELAEERSDIARQKMHLRLALGLILWFLKYVRISANRVKLLSSCNAALQARFSVLLSSDLVLRQRYRDLKELCLTDRRSIEDLSLRLRQGETTQETLEKELAEVKGVCRAFEKDLQFYQALAWTVVARYDGLQSEYGQLLVNFDELKNDCRGFRDDLQGVVAQIQETLDIADIGLNDLQHAVNLRPTKIKQDLMRIGQGLDLVRLNMTELLAGMVAMDGRKAGASSPVTCLPYAPGSIEDAVRKLKTLYEATRANEIVTDHGDEGRVEGDSSVDELQEVTLANISYVEQKDEPLRHVVESLHGIISKIEGDDSRDTLLTSLPSASDIVNKLKQIVDEKDSILTSRVGSRVDPEGDSASMISCARQLHSFNVKERDAKPVNSLPVEKQDCL